LDRGEASDARGSARISIWRSLGHSLSGVRDDPSGFTLIELMVVTSMFLILIGIAVPQYKALTLQLRTTSVATQLASDINFARIQSLRTATTHYVAVTPATGVAYKVQRSAAPPAIVPASDPAVRTVTLTNSMPGVSFSLNGATTDPYGNAVTGATPTGALGFDARGIPLTAGTYFIASSDNANSYAVTVTGAGRVRIWSKVAGAWR